MIALGVLLPLAACWLIAGRLLPNHGRLVRAAAAFGLAVGVTSVEFFVTLLVVGRPSRPASVLFAVALLAAAWVFRPKGPTGPVASAKPSRWIWPAAAFAAWMGVSAGAEVVAGMASSPHGEWDGYAIWNTRARGLSRGGPDWRDAFHPARAHPDYPLLLPATVARLWTWHGSEFPLAGGFFGAACLIGAAALVGAGVGRLRGPELGCLAVGLLLANPLCVSHAAWQYADVPLSFFVCGAVVVWVLGRNGPGGFGPAAVVGLFLGFAAWTKNEGLAFAAVFLLFATTEAVRRRECRRDWLALAIGFAVAFAAVLVFKVTVSAENDLVEGQNRDTLARLTDPARYRTVLNFAWDYFTDQKWFALLMLPAAVLAIGFGPRPPGMFVPTAAVVGTAVVYFLVYVTTPRDLGWHLGTSFDRLVTHLLPAAYFLGFATLRPITSREAGPGAAAAVAAG